MKVLVCGDRHWTNEGVITKFLDRLDRLIPDVLEIIDGHARGADQMAHSWGDKNRITVHCFPAKWQIYGAAAGPIRNSEMLKKAKPDLVVGFHNNIEESQGTKDMLTKALKAGVRVRLITEKGEVKWPKN